MDEYEQSRRSLEELSDWYSKNQGSRNEATTRLHLINDLFLKCLAWPKEAVSVEHRLDRTIADYVFRQPTPNLIVEAKREGKYFELPAGLTREEFDIPKLSRDYEDLSNAMSQASVYCQKRGVQVCAVSNGHQVVVFLGARIDGMPPLEGRAIVFSSLDVMLERYLLLWDLLSPAGLANRFAVRRLSDTLSRQVPSKLSVSIRGYPGVANRTSFQADMRVLGDLVLEDVAERRELEPLFLRECYCQSGALSQHAMVSKSLLRARYAALFDSDTPGPVLESAVTKKGISTGLLGRSWSSRPVLILGDVGVGKTMFLRYMRSVEAEELLSQAITLYIDLGTQAMLTDDLKGFVIGQLQEQLLNDYEIDTEDRNFVRGVYFRDLERFSRGIHSDLRVTEPDLFRRREIEYLEELLAETSTHVRRCLKHVVHGRKRQVVVFVDNADQRDEDVQQKAFLICQEFAEHWPVSVFVTLRPETFHRSIRSGALSGYQPKEFYIAPPVVSRAIEKRLAFAQRIANGEIPESHIPGVGVKLDSLSVLLEAIGRSVREDRSFLQILEHVSGGNVRMALGLLRDFIGSGHVDSERIVRRAKAGSTDLIQPHDLIRSIARGEAVHFDPSRSVLVNLFDIQHADGREHFLLPIAVSLARKHCDPAVADGFVDCSLLAETLQDLGFNLQQIENALRRLSATRLLDVPTRQEITDDLPTQVRITDRGAFHVTWLCREFSYIDAVVVDTPILDPDARASIGDARTFRDCLVRASTFVDYLEKEWTPLRGAPTEFDWTAMAGHIRGFIDRVSRHHADHPK